MMIDVINALYNNAARGPWTLVADPPDEPEAVCEIHNTYNPEHADPLVAEALWKKDADVILALYNSWPCIERVLQAAHRHVLAVEGDKDGRLSGERRDITMRDLIVALDALEKS